ncbi:MAG: alpha/beta fold hydrolase [Clostridiales bacterium]|nr:alpha/beta fold hydrolase [Clostridiales bacterium]
MACKEFYIDSDGIRLHAKLERPLGMEKGPLCFLVHGFTGHMEEGHILAAKDALLDCGISVLRVEMYGHGGSDGKFFDHTLFKWMTNALSVVNYIRSMDDVTDIYMCGHSQGGLLTMLMGGMCPDLFKAIVPLSPAWMIPEQCREGSILYNDFDPAHIPDRVTNENWELSGDYIRVAQTIHVEDCIGRYHGDVLIVHGDADDVVPIFYGQKAEKLYEKAVLVPIHDADHCFNGHIEELKNAIKEYNVI